MIELKYNFRTKRIKELFNNLNISDTGKVEGIILDTRKIDLYLYPYLKVIVRVGVGIDNIDLRSCSERGIKILTTPCRELTDAVAEFTILRTLELLRKQKRNLSDMKIGIIGYGRIGSRVHEILNSMSRNRVTIYDPFIGYGTGFTVRELVKWNNLIFIFVSGTDKIIDEDVKDLFDKHKYIINMARRECINEEVVKDLLLNKNIGGFVSDVNELMVTKEEFKKIENKVILTPHKASDTKDARKAMEILAVEKMVDFFKENKVRYKRVWDLGITGMGLTGDRTVGVKIQ